MSAKPKLIDLSGFVGSVATAGGLIRTMINEAGVALVDTIKNDDRKSYTCFKPFQ